MTDDTDTTRPNSDNIFVVGVVPGQPDRVLETASHFAQATGCALACAYVDAARYAAEFLPNGFMVTMPLDSDVDEEGRQVFPVDLQEQVDRILQPLGLNYTTTVLGGDPADALATFADALDAHSIVVGTRERGFLASIEQLVNGSVGARLAHRQHRPVIVVPLAPSKNKKSTQDEAPKNPDAAAESE